MPTVGRGAFVLYADRHPLCSFSFSYVPGPVAISPKGLPLRGGGLTLAMYEYFTFYGGINCLIHFGNIYELSITLNSSALILTIPSASTGGIVSLSMSCQGIPDTMDLGAVFEYLEPSTVTFTGAGNCFLLQICTLNLALKNPPRSTGSLSKLSFLISGLEDSSKRLTSLQVGGIKSNLEYFSLECILIRVLLSSQT